VTQIDQWVSYLGPAVEDSLSHDPKRQKTTSCFSQYCTLVPLCEVLSPVYITSGIFEVSISNNIVVPPGTTCKLLFL
jgi:hypothetical protein